MTETSALQTDRYRPGMGVASIPLIDLAVATPQDVADALMVSSCAFVTGHGVPSSVHDDMVTLSRSFFDLPRGEKAEVRWPGDRYWRGWLPYYEGPEDLKGSQSPELVEKFEVQLAHPWPGTDDASILGRTADFDCWTLHPEGFRLVWGRYYAALGGLASRILTMIAEALDLPSDQLDVWCDNQYANLVVNNYLAQVEPPKPGQIRIRAHTDLGGLTMLWADDAPGGLQVRLPGTPGWTDVQIPAGASLIQAADVLSCWTNHRIRPNIHRVANPDREQAADSRRMSIVYFHYPQLDAVVD